MSDISYRVKSCFFPPIVAAKDLLKKISPGKKPIINFSQGVPSLLPPDGAIYELKEKMGDGKIHTYSDDRGIYELREEIARDFFKRHGVKISTDNILITAGANMGFFQTLITILNPRDKILIPSPYYFNYVMAAKFFDISVVEEKIEEDKFLNDFDEYVKLGVKAVVFINPENPTGRVYSDYFLRETFKKCAEKNIYFIYDEVYRDFYLSGKRHFSPIEVYGDKNLIVIGSFSKSYGMTGYRVGYMVADKLLIEEILKVQDTNIICPPVISQYLAYIMLKKYRDYPVKYVGELKKNIEIFFKEMSDLKLFKINKPEGSIFSMMYYNLPYSSLEMVKMIYEKEGILLVAGESFGRFSKKSLRISFNDLNLEKILTFKERMENFEKWVKEKL